MLAEDQAMVLGAFASLLELEPDVEVVATASDGDEALAAVEVHRPDVLLTDIEMPGRTGLDVVAWETADPLTERERDVLRLAAEGHPNAEVAAQLHLAEGTVRNYLSGAIAKLGARNRTDAARLARERGLL